MEREKVWREFMDLTMEDQQKVADFISSLRGESRSTRFGKRTNLEDSTAWVRETRELEWAKRRG